MERESVTVMAPWIQFGFAGFCFVLICFLWWTFKELLKVLKETNAVVSRNSEVMNKHLESQERQEKMLDRILGYCAACCRKDP